MNNKNKSFFRYFYYCFIIVVICVIFCGIAIGAVSTKLYKDEKFKELEAVCDLFTGGVKDEFELTNSMNAETIKNFHTGFVENYGLSMFVYDENGNCLLTPEGKSNAPLSADFMDQIDTDTVIRYDTAEISKSEPSIVYGDRFYVRYGEEVPHRLYVVAYSPTDDINNYTAKMIVAIICMCIIVLIPVRMLLFKKASKISAEITEFNRIIENYSKGDFSEKIDANKMKGLQQTSQYINTLAAEVETADETSKTFIANVSHELRTPMTTIGGFVDGILDGTIPKSRQQEYLVLVSNEIKRLKILISSMLNMTRFESGTLKPNFKETSLTNLVIQTVLMFEKKITDKNVEIDGLDSDRLIAVVDADLIQQVVYNLVENAVKFVNQGGTISFRFEKNNGVCTVGVRNTGEGLKNDEIPQVFDRFYKADSSRGKDTTGLGLGLSISRRIIHLHDGKIIVKSVYGEYTEFLIELPEKRNN